MKDATIKATFCGLIAALTLAMLACVAPAADFFVAPDGNDGNPGTRQRPFATLEGARDAVRELKQKGVAGPVTVQLRGGRYALSKPLELTAQDSGAEGQPVTYRCYADEKVVLSGGKEIRGWRKHDARLWVADVPWAKDRKEPFTELFVGGVRRPRARTPNAGSYFYSRRLHLTDAAKHPQCLGLSYNPGDLGPWANRSDAVIVLFHNWVNSYNYIQDFDATKQRITFARPAGIFFLGPHVRYYVENVFQALDDPGEWFFDRATSLLYYYPLAGEDIEHTEVIAPAVTATLLAINGDPEKGRFVERLVFRGISLQHTDANLARDYEHSVQGAHTQKGAIFATGLRHSVIEDCEFTRLGEHAVSLREGCQWNVVRRCHITDVGGGGIYLSEGWPKKGADALLTAHNRIDNNFIHDNGHIFRAGCGVFLGGSASYNEITHNEICNQSWVGVHMGWSWTGKVRSFTHDNTVAYNHLHHLGNGVLNDLGGIYTLGDSPGTVLHHNHIHDITRFERGRMGYGGWGIYLDAGSSEIRIENNLVYRTRDGGFYITCVGFPHGNMVRNNIFACSADAQVMRDGHDEPEASHFQFKRNIVYGERAQLFRGDNWMKESNFISDDNCLWSTSGSPPVVAGKTFTQWQAEGRDQHSLVADPCFAKPGEGDFSLTADSPPLAIGFRPIDVSTAGLHGDAAWIRLARELPHRPSENPVTVDAGATPLQEDFEDYNVGSRPDEARLVEENTEAIIRVSNDCTASGKQSLKLVDGPGQRRAWNPNMYYETWYDAGMVEGSFDLRLEPGAMFQHKWRDSVGGGTYVEGPLLSVEADGALKVGGKKLTQLPHSQWVNLRIIAGTGPQANGRWQLTVRVAGQEPQHFADLRCDPKFNRLTWYGFSSLATTRTVFYLDNITLRLLPAGMSMARENSIQSWTSGALIPSFHVPPLLIAHRNET